MVFNLTSNGQNDICVLEDVSSVFYLNKDWDAEKRKEVSLQYGLDSLMLEQVLSAPLIGDFEFEDQAWGIH
jgi:hypothetical protein